MLENELVVERAQSFGVGKDLVKRPVTGERRTKKYEFLWAVNGELPRKTDCYGCVDEGHMKSGLPLLAVDLKLRLSVNFTRDATGHELVVVVLRY